MGVQQLNAIASIHKYLDDRYAEAETFEKKRDVEKTRGLLVGYAMHYENDGLKTIKIEYPVEEKLVDPETGDILKLKGLANDPTYGGIMDTLLEKDGRILIGDHKTSSRVDDAYWEELKMNGQLSHYQLLAYQKGWPIDGFLWDVIKKPGIDPKRITQAAKVELQEGGTYCGIRMRTESDLQEALEAKTETAVMYGMRVMVDTITDPDKYYFRRIIHRHGDDLDKYLTDMVNIRKAMHRIETGVLPAYRNRNACRDYGRVCDYFTICSGENEEEMGFRVREPSQEPRALTSGCLTTSRMACFLSCPFKYQKKYMEKLEPIRQEYSDSLAIGTMLHKGIELILNDPARQSTIKLETLN